MRELIYIKSNQHMVVLNKRKRPKKNPTTLI